MLVYFKNQWSKIAVKRSNNFFFALCVGETVNGDNHSVIVTPVPLNNAISSGYGGGYKVLETWTDPQGTESIPSIACTDGGVAVAAWIKKEGDYTRVMICSQPFETENWNAEWTSPVEIHLADSIDGICCLPQHGGGGVDIYFRARTISHPQEWGIYRAWTDENGNYLGTELVTDEYETWTAAVLPNSTKVLIFQVNDPYNSNALKILINSGTGWESHYLPVFVKMENLGEYLWIPFNDAEFEDGTTLDRFWDTLKGGGADKDGIIHLMSMSLGIHPEQGSVYIEDMYIRIDISVMEARGEFPFSQMSVEMDVDTDFEEGLSVDVSTGRPHIFFEGPGQGVPYNQTFHATKDPSQSEWGSYSLIFDGTREFIGASTRDDFGGYVAFVGNHWEWLDNKLLRGSIKTINCSSISPEKSVYMQSANDTQASFITNIITNSQGDQIPIDETFSRIILPSKEIIAFSNPFPFTNKMAVDYDVVWSPSFNCEGYLMWLCRGGCSFKYLLPDLHVHTVELDHNTLDAKTTKIKAMFHNCVHEHPGDTDSVPQEFICRFYFNNPDPNLDGYVSDPLPPDCEQIGEDIVVQGLQKDTLKEVVISYFFDGQPRTISVFVAIDVIGEVNESQIYYDEGAPVESRKNNILGSTIQLLGVINLNTGTDKLVYRDNDEKVTLTATTQDAFGFDIPSCKVNGIVRLPYSQTILPTDPDPWTEISPGTYMTYFPIPSDHKAGFYGYFVTASKENYVPAQDQGTFLLGKMFGGSIAVEPTPNNDSIEKKESVFLNESFAGAKGNITITSVRKSNMNSIEFDIEERENDLGEIIESFQE